MCVGWGWQGDGCSPAAGHLQGDGDGVTVSLMPELGETWHWEPSAPTGRGGHQRLEKSRASPRQWHPVPCRPRVASQRSPHPCLPSSAAFSRCQARSGGRKDNELHVLMLTGVGVGGSTLGCPVVECKKGGQTHGQLHPACFWGRGVDRRGDSEENHQLPGTRTCPCLGKGDTRVRNHCGVTSASVCTDMHAGL